MLQRPPPRDLIARRAERRARRRRRAQANRERVQRAAERRARGVACYTIEIGADVLDMLVRLQWLADSDVTDRRKVEVALAKLLADAARR